jgi:hypothetical protein
MTPDIDNVGAAIVKGICNPEAKDLAVDLGEFEFGALLDESVLQEIPIIKSVIACRKTWTAIHDQLFLRKVVKFLVTRPNFTKEEQEAFVREHLSDSKKVKKLGDVIVLILDKFDDFEKPEMLAKVFAAHVRGKIPFENFRRLASAIDIGFIEDLKVLANKPKVPPGYLYPYLPNLVRTNLVTFQAHETFEVSSEGKVNIGFNISLLGEIFVKCLNNSF